MHTIKQLELEQIFIYKQPIYYHEVMANLVAVMCESMKKPTTTTSRGCVHNRNKHLSYP